MTDQEAMSSHIDTAIIRILAGDQTAGTGFVLHENGLMVTCAHVVAFTGAGPGEQLRIVFHQTGIEGWALVEPAGWREPEAEDVAILRLQGPLPAGVTPLPLGASDHAAGHPFETYGFPAVNEAGGLRGAGQIMGPIRLNGLAVLQLRSGEVTTGFSGAPIWDAAARRVVGMVTAITGQDQHLRPADTALATPSQMLREAWPELTLSDICPYPGLAAFTEAEAEFYFGREALVEKLWSNLRRHPRLLVVVGPSGSGKSSVVRACLTPKMGQEKLFLVRPGADPFKALALAGLAIPEDKDLQAAVRDLQTGSNSARRVVFVIDQFEELFSLCPEPVQDDFMNQLLALLGSTLPVTIILALRANFYGHLLRYNRLIEWLEGGQVPVPPLSLDELKMAIEQPARRLGLRFEPGLVEIIAAEAAQINYSLPLLQSALVQLWQHRYEGMLTHKAYRDPVKVGGVIGAIGKWAEDSFSPLEDHQKRLAKHIFTRLIHYGQGEADDTRRRRTLAELTLHPEQLEMIQALTNHFANARLLVTDGDLAGAGTVEIVHDAVLWEWERLREWRKGQREFYLWRQRLDDRYQEWQDKQEDNGALLQGALLTEAEQWLDKQGDNLSQARRTYIERSIAFREERRQVEEKRRREQLKILQELAETQKRRAEEQIQTIKRLRLRAILLAAALLIALLAILSTLFYADRSQRFALQSQQEAENAVKARQTAEAENAIARSRELAASAVAVLPRDPELAILLALEAITPTYTTEAEYALRQAIRSARVEATLTDHNGPLRAVTYSPDGLRLATAGDDGIIRLWTANEPYRLELSWTGHISPVHALAFDPDGRRLATAGLDQMVKLWDATTGQLLTTLNGHTGRINRLAFSPDGHYLATVSADQTARLWPVAGNAAGLILAGHTAPLYGVAFSPDGRYLATAGSDRQTLLWDLHQVVVQPGATVTKPIRSLAGHIEDIYGLAFSPCLDLTELCQDYYLATAGQDKTIKIWDMAAEQDQPLISLPDPSTIYSLSFSPNGDRLAIASADRTAKIWEVSTGKLLLTLAGHSEPVFDVAFSPRDEGMHLATTSTDGAVKIWNLGYDQNMLAGHSGWVNQAVFSPDERYIVSTSLDKTARVWDLASRQPITTLTGFNHYVIAAAFDPQGRHLTTTSFDGSLRIWDSLSWTEQYSQSLGVWLGDVAYSPDGTHLAVTAFDNLTRIWDTLSWQQVLTLTGHTQPVYSLAFNPAGDLIATGSQDQAIIWEAATGRPVRELAVQTGPIYALAFNPAIQSQLITASGDGRTTARVWDITTGDVLYTFYGHTAQVNSLIFTQDGSRLITASSDQTIKVWDLPESFQAGLSLKPFTLPVFGDQVSGIKLSPSQKYLAVSLADGTIYLESLDVNFLPALARQRLTRWWQPAECQLYLNRPDCPPEY